MRVLSYVVDTHHRTPGYVKGKVGRVETVSGRFHDPESCAYGGSGLPKRELYLIGFDMRTLWGDEYRGGHEDRLLVDVYEQWLEPVDDSVGFGEEHGY